MDGWHSDISTTTTDLITEEGEKETSYHVTSRHVYRMHDHVKYNIDTWDKKQQRQHRGYRLTANDKNKWQHQVITTNQTSSLLFVFIITWCCMTLHSMIWIFLIWFVAVYFCTPFCYFWFSIQNTSDIPSHHHTHMCASKHMRGSLCKSSNTAYAMPVMVTCGIIWSRYPCLILSIHDYIRCVIQSHLFFFCLHLSSLFTSCNMSLPSLTSPSSSTSKTTPTSIKPNQTLRTYAHQHQ